MRTRLSIEFIFLLNFSSRSFNNCNRSRLEKLESKWIKKLKKGREERLKKKILKQEADREKQKKLKIFHKKMKPITKILRKESHIKTNS